VQAGAGTSTRVTAEHETENTAAVSALRVARNEGILAPHPCPCLSTPLSQTSPGVGENCASAAPASAGEAATDAAFGDSAGAGGATGEATGAGTGGGGADTVAAGRDSWKNSATARLRMEWSKRDACVCGRQVVARTSSFRKSTRAS